MSTSPRKRSIPLLPDPNAERITQADLDRGLTDHQREWLFKQLDIDFALREMERVGREVLAARTAAQQSNQFELTLSINKD